MDEISGDDEIAAIQTGYIEKELDESAREILRTAPKELLLLAGVSRKASIALMSYKNPRRLEVEDVTVDSETSEVKVTITNHRLETGRKLVLSGVVGMSGVNNDLQNPSWSITVLDRHSFILDGATASGIYETGGTVTGLPHSVIIPVLDDFLRLIRLNLDTWTKPQGMMVAYDSYDFQQNFNQYNPNRRSSPTIALRDFPFTYSYTQGEGNDAVTTTVAYHHAIECFPAPSYIGPELYQLDANDDEDYAALLSMAESSGYRGIIPGGPVDLITDFVVIEVMPAENLPSTLHDSLTWLTASRCFTILRENAMAKEAFSRYTESLTGGIGGS